MLEGVDDETARIYCLNAADKVDPEVTQESTGPYVIEDLFLQWLADKIITQAEYDEAQRALKLFADHIQALANA